TVRVVQCTQDTFTARLSDDSSVEVDKVMFALGRWPNVADLGLDAAGVRFTPNRGIAVHPPSQTSVPHIHAVRDVTHRVHPAPGADPGGPALARPGVGGQADGGRPYHRADRRFLRARGRRNRPDRGAGLRTAGEG